MRAPHRRVDPGLITQLAQAPRRFDFFQAVRVLEHAMAGGGNGEALAGERIRFRSSLSLAFAPSPIEGLALEGGSDSGPVEGSSPERAEITTSFISLLGLHGTLPLHYTERVAERRQAERDDAPRAFLDLFGNRAVAQFYRAWKKYRPYVQFEQDRRNRFLPMLQALSGLGFRALRDRLHDGCGGVHDESLARFAVFLRQRPVSAALLQKLISHYFRLPIRIEQFVGQWYELPAAQQSRLGRANVALGQSLLLGGRVWQCDLRARLVLGPLCRERFAEFLPVQSGTTALARLLGVLCGCAIEFELRPVLRAADVVPIRLGATHAVRLGYDSFLVTRPGTSARSDPVFDLQTLS